MRDSTIFVAVHGIGDQIRNETIQAVARRVFANAGKVSALPLGSFKSRRAWSDETRDEYIRAIAQRVFEDSTRAAPNPSEPPWDRDADDFGPLFPDPPLETAEFGEVGFAEVYWADITRRVETAGYTLEESKLWATTLVERIRQRAGEKLKSLDYELMQQVLNEMIDTLDVSDHLLGLARRTNLGQFDLKKVLDQFLGDVQFFTEFEKVRADILTVFNDTMEAAHHARPDADIVLVAHSEGTVVAFMGLLLAAAGKSASGERDVGQPAWFENVTALMTLGSPIDKHLILWPELWGDVKGPANPPRTEPIDWWNYYDLGDPVGAELDYARRWLENSGYPNETLFTFSRERDIGFTRYPFPGKAHVDYWTDAQLFDHFLDEVASKPERAAKPKTKVGAWWISYVLPYGIAAAVLFLAVYALSKGAAEVGVAHGVFFQNLIGYTSILAGMTIFSRIPRLVRRGWWCIPAILVFVAGAAGYYFTTVAFNDREIAAGKVVENVLLYGWGLIPLAFSVAVIGTAVGHFKPRWGMKSLVGTGTLAAIVLVGLSFVAGGSQNETTSSRSPCVWSVATNIQPNAAGQQTVAHEAASCLPADPSVWPVLVGGAFFLYLWWLSALLFDLVFVWHRNIRRGQTEKILEGLFEADKPMERPVIP